VLASLILIVSDDILTVSRWRVRTDVCYSQMQFLSTSICEHLEQAETTAHARHGTTEAAWLSTGRNTRWRW